MPRRRAVHRRGVSDRLLSLVIFAVILAVMEILVTEGVVSPLLLAAPSDILDALRFGLTEGTLRSHAWSTVSATAVGFGVASLVGFGIGSVFVLVPRVERVAYPFIVALQSLPKIAIAPLLLLWIGYGHTTKIVLITIIAFFPILVNATEGLRVRDKGWLELMNAIGASRLQTYWYVRVPSSAPYVFAGLRIGVVYAGLGAVAAEFVGSQTGLGVALLTAQAQFNLPLVFGCLILLMVMGLTFSGVIRLIEGRVVFWAKERPRA